MPAPYSYDLRQKAVDAIDRGEKKSHICRTLNISRNTLDIWLKLRDESILFGYARKSYGKKKLTRCVT